MRTQLCHVLVNFGIFFYTAQVSYSSACLLNKKFRSNKFPFNILYIITIARLSNDSIIGFQFR